MKSQLDKKVKGAEGFTLIELLIVMVLIIVVVSMISATFIISTNTSRDVIEITTSGIDSRVTMYRISKDLREAVNLTKAENDEIIFQSDVDSDGDYEILNYYLADADGHYNLYRKVDNESAKIVADNIVKNNLFAYYTDIDIPEGGMDTVDETELASIKIIEIKLSIDQGGTESERTMELKTSIALRNKI
ncbi:MAG: prepilin-type N-terminal cleavage/methylation domain-containing protein [Actinomycetota bacterium]|nr:prepilin-type N-terminal cleavage/methylation domain-containing protein [Actinomycetota bacterium]